MSSKIGAKATSFLLPVNPGGDRPGQCCAAFNARQGSAPASLVTPVFSRIQRSFGTAAWLGARLSCFARLAGDGMRLLCAGRAFGAPPAGIRR